MPNDGIYSTEESVTQPQYLHSESCAVQCLTQLSLDTFQAKLNIALTILGCIVNLEHVISVLFFEMVTHGLDNLVAVDGHTSTKSELAKRSERLLTQLHSASFVITV